MRTSRTPRRIATSYAARLRERFGQSTRFLLRAKAAMTEGGGPDDLRRSRRLRSRKGACSPDRCARRITVARLAADEVGHQTGPSCLVSCSKAGSVVGVEVLVEQEVVLPGWVALKPVDPSKARPAAVRTGQEDRGQTAAQVAGDCVQRQVPSGSCGVLDYEVVAKELVVALE